jgi:hypothetical protein
MTCCNTDCNQGRDCPLRELPEVTSPFEAMTDFLWAVATIAAACVVSAVCTTLLIWSLT